MWALQQIAPRMPTINKLTDARCKVAKPADKPQKMADGHGLYLYVSTLGAKSWRVAYRLAGKPQTATFGLYPEVSLAEARQRRDELRARLRDGADPRAVHAPKRSKLLRDAVAEYWAGRGDVSESYRSNALACMERYILPRLGAADIRGISRADVLDALRPMDAAGHHVYVRKARMWLSLVFAWAVEHEHCDANPAALINPKTAFGRAQVQSFAALSERDIPGLMRRLRFEGDLQSALACLFLAYTWTRTTEMRGAMLSEFDGDTWVIPAERMKMGREHIVPLPRQAVALRDKLARLSRGGPYLFPGDRDHMRPMSENAVLYLLHRMGYKGRMTGHGWRSVASTWANERGFKPDAVERQLAHAPADRVRSADNRAEHLPLRREMLQTWADWLDAQGD